MEPRGQHAHSPLPPEKVSLFAALSSPSLGQTDQGPPGWSHGHSGNSLEPALTEMPTFSEDFGLNVEYGSRWGLKCAQYSLGC